MMRGLLAVVAIAGCSKSSGGVDVGRIKHLSIDLETSREEPPRYYLGVRFDVQPPAEELVVRAWCEVDEQRFEDVGPAELDATARPGDMPPSVPFITTTLAKPPARCELAFVEAATDTTPLGVVCVRPGQRPAVGPCPATPP